MAGSERDIKRRYNTPGVIDGSLARDLDHYERKLDNSGHMAVDEYYYRREETAAERSARERKQAKEAVRPAQKVSLGAVVGFAVVAVLMMSLVLCYVQINTISSSIVSMKKQISKLETEQVSLLTRYEQAFDLATVKEAAQRVGMSQPSDSQIQYIALPGQDATMVYAAQDSGLLKGVTASLNDTVQAAVEYFR